MSDFAAEGSWTGMIDSSHTIDGAAVCGDCGISLGKRRYVQLNGSFLDTFCSELCVRAASRAQTFERWAARLRYAKWLTVGTIFIGAGLTPHHGPPRLDRPIVARPSKVKAVAASGPAQPPPGWFGPEWPPTEISLLAALGRDAWLHPMPGPVRRMPRTDARVFGAVRPGDRAVECRNGHCGVDLGGEIWGEHVHAVHDGVVDHVQRGANPQRGGRFVRLSHRRGTVFTQYFHLAAIPRGIERGMPIKGGDLIGLLGDTGVKESAPHLHFTISIRPVKDGPDKYIDPEPLIALWPLRVPVDGGEVGLVTTVGEPGVPLGSLPLKPARERKLAKEKLAKRRRGGGESAKKEQSGSVRAKPSPEEDESPSETDTPESSPED